MRKSQISFEATLYLLLLGILSVSHTTGTLILFFTINTKIDLSKFIWIFLSIFEILSKIGYRTKNVSNLHSKVLDRIIIAQK